MVQTNEATIMQLVSNYFAGVEIPKFHQFIKQAQDSGEIWDIANNLSEEHHSLTTQYFGLTLLESAVRSLPFGTPTDDRHILQKLLIKIGRLIGQANYSKENLLNALLKKSVEVLVHFLFRTIDAEAVSIRKILNSLITGCEEDTDFTASLCRRPQSVALFLTILLEEFDTEPLPFHIKNRIKKVIYSEGPTILRMLQTLLNNNLPEELLVMTMNCCSLWISTMSNESEAIDFVGFTDLLYSSMSQSEYLFAKGLECLITLLENGGLGLQSGRDTAHLLDYHVRNLVQLQHTINNLIQSHSVALHEGIVWSIFEHRELLVKTALILSTLAEDQMVNLLNRLVQGESPSETNVHTLFRMFLFPLSTMGHYPREQSIADLGAQIWFSLLDGLSSVAGSEKERDWKFLDAIQNDFAHAALQKCKYPSKLNEFWKLWTSEERAQWYKLRSELGDTFLLAYTGHRTVAWFENLLWELESSIARLAPLPHTGTLGGDLVVDLEARLFVLKSISDQLTHELSNTSDLTAQFSCAVIRQLTCLLNCLSTAVSGLSNLSETELITQSVSLIAGSLLDVSCEYLPAAQKLCPFPTKDPFVEWLISFLLSCMDICGRTDVYNKLWPSFTTSVFNALRKVLQECSVIRDHTEQVIRCLMRFDARWFSSTTASSAHAWKAIGMLMPYTSDYTFFNSLIRSQPDLQAGYWQCEKLAGSSEECTSHKSARSMTNLVEYIIGIGQTVDHLTDCKSETQDHLCWLAREHVTNVLLQFANTVGRFLLDHYRLHRITLDQFLQLFITGLPVCLPKHLNAANPGYLEQVSLLSNVTFHLATRLLAELPQLNELLLQTVWFLIQTPFRSEPITSHASLAIATPSIDLLLTVLRRIDTDLTSEAVRLARTFEAGTLTDNGGLLQHPISPHLMSLGAQHMTEQIELAAKFFNWIVDFNVPPAFASTENCTARLLCILDQYPVAVPASSWKLGFSVCFAGLCVPEWSTAECCIRLTKALLSHLCDPQHSLQLSLVVTPNFLFQLHSALVLVLARGALPRRLVPKYADLYQTLSLIKPNWQFQLLRLILGLEHGHSDELSQIEQSPVNRVILDSVTQAIAKTSIAQREHFTKTAIRAFTPTATVGKALSQFSAACEPES